LKIHEYADVGTCAQALSDALAAAVTATLAEKPRATLALSGGRSPEAVLPLLAAQRVDWSRVDVTLVDERRVPLDHGGSNAGLVRRCFMEQGAKAASFVPLWTGDMDLDDALAASDARLTPVLPCDVAYLGMGPDGHIASLFPTDSKEKFECDGFAVISSEAPSAPHERISLTLSELLKGSKIFLHVTGAEKRHALEQAAAHPPSPAVPVSLLLHARSDVQVYACD